MIIYITQNGAQSEPVDESVNCGDNCHEAIARALRSGSGYINIDCIAKLISEINHRYIYRKSSRIVTRYIEFLIRDLKLLRRMGANCAITPEPLQARRLDKHDAKNLYKKAP